MRCDWIHKSDYQVMQGKNILVAGGTGFIGRRAVEIFNQLGMNVFVISRKKHEDIDSIRYEVADLNNLESLKSVFKDIQFDYAVYMAANIPVRGSEKESYFDAKRSTFDPFMNFCEAFMINIKSFVYVSSVDVYGGCSAYEYDESAEIRIATPYGIAKYMGEFYTKNICGVSDIPYSVLRFSQVYGPNEPLVRIIPIIKKALREDTEFTLITDGSERRRFLFVDDAVKAVIHGLIYARSEVYNIAGPDVITMKGLVELIENTWDKSVRLVIKNEKKGEDNVPSYRLAQENIKFVPEVTMAEGMRITMEEETC